LIHFCAPPLQPANGNDVVLSRANLSSSKVTVTGHSGRSFHVSRAANALKTEARFLLPLFSQILRLSHRRVALLARLAHLRTLQMIM
tara:strand:- start:156 stop:416 length:261 start_codon:yes stop_codon:yes gene_type:complete